MCSRSAWLFLALSLLLFCVTAVYGAGHLGGGGEPAPNVVVLVAADMGMEDVRATRSVLFSQGGDDGKVVHGQGTDEGNDDDDGIHDDDDGRHVNDPRRDHVRDDGHRAGTLQDRQ